MAATATDGDGHRATRAWTVLVHRTDADGDAWTATTDCDDGDAAVHPGQIEFLGNGVDDDCDAGSPDAPPGGLTGQPYGWGHNTFGQTGKGVFGGEYHTPQKTVLPNTVVQAETGHRTGYAVLADGSVRAWGYNLDGALGDGSTVSQRATPVPVSGIDGAGALAGVTRISADGSHAAAARTDGTVVTWGGNANRQLGNGSTVGSRNVPGLVLTAANTPLTGVRDVESGEGADYALMADGTVKAWGNVTCAGASTDVKPYATTVPGLTDIRQIATGSSMVFFVRTDGTVLSCGGTDLLLGRVAGNVGTPTSAYLPNPVNNLGRGGKVVDVSSNGAAAVVLKEDGSVFMWGKSTNDDLSALELPRGGSTKEPTRVTLPDGPPVVGVEKDASQTTLAIRADGSMLAWGGNLYGVTGTGQTGTVRVPTLVSLPGQVFLQASTSDWNALALTRPAADPDLELPASWVSATVADASLSEAAGGAFTVKLDHPLADDVALTWSLRSDTAGEDDVALGSGTVVVEAGQTEASIPVDVTDDVLDEDDETVTLALTGARLGLTIARAQAGGTIVDNDDAPTVSVDPATVAEGGTSLADAPVRVRLSKPSGKEVVATYTTAAGTATAGEDYVQSAASLRFAPGETEKVIHLSVHGDALVEPDETFTVALDDVTNGTAGGAGTVTITDDEVLTVSVSAPTLAEGTSGTFVVTVQPAPGPGTTVAVPWSLAEPQAGPADEPGDIAAAGGRLELDAEHPSATITATTVDDSTVESPEPFQVVLGDLVASDGRTVLRGEVGTAWIADNDRANRPPVVHTAGQVSGVEGSALALDGTVSDDAAGVISSWTVDGPCAITGEGPQSSATCADDGVYTATLTAVDSDGASVSATTTLTVANAAPVLGDVAVDAAGARIEFSDAGPLDQHTCTVDWGDQTTTGALDGAVSPCYLPHNYGVGTFTATVTVTDDDNGSVSATRTAKVTSVAWPFLGFLRPVDNPPAINVVKAGQSIPVKFGLGGYRGMNILAAGSPASGTVTCGGGEPNAVEETVTAGGSSLSYDAGNDHYTYVWKTDKVWAGQCRRLVVTLTDGTQHWAEFQFR